MSHYGTENLGEYIEHLEIDRNDFENARKAWEFISPSIKDVMVEFYQTKYLVHAHKNAKNFEVDALIEKQIQYWSEFFSGQLDVSYSNHVRKISISHRLNNVTMTHFILAYGWLANRFEMLVWQNTGDEAAARALSASIRRLVFLDMALAASAYYAVFID